MDVTLAGHGLRGVDHVGLTVPDLEAAVSFFCNVLGAEHFFSHGPYPGSEQTPAQFGRPRESRVDGIAMVRLGAMNIELLQITSPWRSSEPPRPDDAGGHHLALYVDHIDAAVSALRAAQVDVLGSSMALPGPESGVGGRFVFFRAPWGTLFELVSYPDGKAYESGTTRRLHDPRESSIILG